LVGIKEGGAVSNGTSPQISYNGTYFVESALSTAGACYGLNVANAAAEAGAAIILWPWAGGQLNELWQFDPDGHLISLLDANLVIGLGGPVAGSSGNYLCLCSLDTGDVTQQWTVTESGMLQNQSSGMVIDVQGGVGADGASIITNEPNTDAPDELWWLAPAVSSAGVPVWCFIQSQLSEDPYGLNVGQLNVTLEPWQAGQPNLLWQLDLGDASIQSQSGGESAVLTPSAVGLPLLTLKNVGLLSQQWSWTSMSSTSWLPSSGPQIIYCRAGIQGVISVAGDTPGNSPNVVSAPYGGCQPENTWQVIPANNPAAILMLPPTAFPAFTGTQALVYTWINQNLNPPLGSGDTPDLRGQYTNNNFSADACLSQIVGMKNPKIIEGTRISDANWEAVTEQLKAELSEVPDVQLFINNYLAFHTALFVDKGARLSQLATDAEISNSTLVNGLGLAVIQGVIYTLLELDEDTAALGNWINSAISAGTAPGSSTPMSNAAFQVAYSELWEQLSSNFQQLYQSACNMAWVILSDWGKLQAMAASLVSEGPGGLYWPDNADTMNNAIPGYVQAVMQMLLPTRYGITWYNDFEEPCAGTNDPLSGSWCINVGAGTEYSQIYQISDAGGNLPSSQAMNDVFGSQMQGVVSGQDFYTGTGGWNFQVRGPVG
jgi:hypothetical protein